MLEIGSFRTRVCQGMSRRTFLRAGLLAPLALGLAKSTASAADRKVKSVLLLWLWGGPSHLDTFDPKPNAPVEFRGPFSPIATKVTGLRISELFPKLAQQADRFTLIRSLHTGSNDHGV